MRLVEFWLKTHMHSANTRSAWQHSHFKYDSILLLSFMNEHNNIVLDTTHV